MMQVGMSDRRGASDVAAGVGPKPVSESVRGFAEAVAVLARGVERFAHVAERLDPDGRVRASPVRVRR